MANTWRGSKDPACAGGQMCSWCGQRWWRPLSSSELRSAVQSLLEDLGNLPEWTTTSLALSFVRAIHKAGTRGGSSLRQKLMPSGFCWTAEVLLLRCKSCCWEQGRGLAFLNLFLISTALSGKWTLWDIPYVRAEHPLQHALTTTWGNDFSLKIFPLFFQLAGYQFFWGTWKEKIITSFELIASQNDPSLWGSPLRIVCDTSSKLGLCVCLSEISSFKVKVMLLQRLRKFWWTFVTNKKISVECCFPSAWGCQVRLKCNLSIYFA